MQYDIFSSSHDAHTNTLSSAVHLRVMNLHACIRVFSVGGPMPFVRRNGDRLTAKLTEHH